MIVGGKENMREPVNDPQKLSSKRMQNYSGRRNKEKMGKYS